jgi:hypothetical protein
MLDRCPTNDLVTILETFGAPAFVAGPVVGGSTSVLAANGRLLAVLEDLPLAGLTASLEREFERCRSSHLPLELDHEVALPRRTESWRLVLAPVPLDDAVPRIVVTGPGRGGAPRGGSRCP